MQKNSQPTAVELPPNPVWRSYLGGSVLRRFRGALETPDDHLPEDWLASTVRARNGIHARDPEEGLSRVSMDGKSLLLADWLEKEPEFWFGSSEGEKPRGPGVLWKLLDSSVRLHLQAHPSAAFARRYLNSNAGKTECWYILSTRGEGHVHLGFQHAPDSSAWERMIREQRLEEMRACFEKIPVRPGECYVVPAGTPHAIGEGVFMLELQEPTDWVVRCEFAAGGLTLPPESCLMGLSVETCMEVFDFAPTPIEQVRRKWQQQPRVLRETGGLREEEIIGANHHEFFRLHRLRGTGDVDWTGGELMLLIALKGEGAISGGGTPTKAGAGQTLLLPGSARQWHWDGVGGDWEILLAKRPAKTESGQE